ncbi:MAG: hypothetical protein IJ740_11715 [Ruminococcus sp.]|nr:hypothetical protein [Ruminococcus sp.]
MDNKVNHNKPANPAPPLNALKNPEVKKAEPVRYRSVYDEIAERRKREKHKIGISSSEEREVTSFHFGDEITEIIDEVKQNREAEKPSREEKIDLVVQKIEDADVKVYNPDKQHIESNIYSKSESQDEIPQFPEEIYSDDGEETVYDDEENFDVPPIPEPPKRVGLWVALIVTLSLLCVVAAGAYGVVNGYFDGIISML